MADEFDVVCLGGGVAGESLTTSLAGSGLTLAVVERHLVGGECPYYGCVPSKTLLRSAQVLAEAGRARELAASRVEWDTDFEKVSKRVLWMARDLDDAGAARALEGQGAVLVRGEGRLTGSRTVAVGDRTLTARQALVIAAGTVPMVPPVPGLDEVDYWTNRQAAVPRELPARLLVLGGGAIGVELAQGFRRLGSEVDLVEAGPRLLAAEEPEAGELLQQHLEAEGIRVHLGRRPARAAREGSASVLELEGGESLRGDRLLVATGRRTDLAGWDLAAAGVEVSERGWVKVDRDTLEAAPGVYAVGDVNGIGGFTHLSWFQADIVGRRIKGEDARASAAVVPRVTFTDPEVASAGLSEHQARERGVEVSVSVSDPGESARGYIEDFKGGTVKLVADRGRGVLVGATLVTPRAGEILGELLLAIQAEVPLHRLQTLMHPFPAFNRVLGGAIASL